MAGQGSLPVCLLDSNIFLRVFVGDYKQKLEDCKEILGFVSERRIDAYLPALVVIEVQFVLDSFYQFEKKRVIEAIKSMISVPNLSIVDDLSLPLATDLFEKHNVKFTDCLLASSTRIQEGTAVIVSYDRDFDKLGVRRLEPKDFLR